VSDYTNEELIFGLDIGTRTVVGIVGCKTHNKFKILGCESIEHEERAMLDGQIHDIQKVCKAVYQIKTTLEQKLNIQLTQVAIAAAGRALNTQIISVESDHEEIQEFTAADVHNLELYGVEKAKDEQQKVGTKMDYFCVAYSVINYYLDGYIISNLEGHKGMSIGAKMIATFLPKLVVDSLYGVTERCGLTVTHLTLEPIAAINAVIPENLRLLNLALVDIGAGTSDIAITKDGSVVAYGMIPIAGDEVTEAIVHKYLVDFYTAEKIKQQLTVSEVITFEDILGLPQQVTTLEVKQVILETINHLTQSIADKILELNGDAPPNAVFCVGGGSQMLSVIENLATFLKLPEQRVALRTSQNVSEVLDDAGIVNGPEMITPLGICITAMKNKYSQFVTVTLNDKNVQLLNAKKLTILDAIVASGIEHTDIFPKRGKTLMFKLDGSRMRIKGENGVSADIFLNGKPATINDSVAEDDSIKVVKAVHGKDGKADLTHYIKETFTVYVNGEKFTIPIVLVNGDCMPENYSIQENDDIHMIHPHHVGELLDYLRIDCQGKMVTVNFNKAEPEHKLYDGASILIDELSHQGQAVLEAPLADTIQTSEKEPAQIDRLQITVNGAQVILPSKEMPYMLASIFDYIAFDLTKPQGTIQLIKNGSPAALTDSLENKDVLEIYWKK
jgi:cell division protein FtsA